MVTDRPMSEAKDRRPLTIRELKEETGLSISTLRRRVKDGSIPVIQAGGPGKKLLFPATVVEELCARRVAQPDAAKVDAERAVGDTRQCPSRPRDDCAEADRPHENEEYSFNYSGVTQPESGPVPSWMRSPLLNNRKPNRDHAENSICQDNARTN
jgi:hypothetical protein